MCTIVAGRATSLDVAQVDLHGQIYSCGNRLSDKDPLHGNYEAVLIPHGTELSRQG
jgi:hypothetical protein